MSDKSKFDAPPELVDNTLPVISRAEEITFVNVVLNRGVLNGVVNVTLGAYNFTPTDTKVLPDPVIVSRLRMDLVAARDLYDSLGVVLGLDMIKHTPVDPGHTSPIGKPN